MTRIQYSSAASDVSTNQTKNSRKRPSSQANFTG